MKYFKNTSWLFAEKILRMTVGLFVGIWVARYLGPEQYGLLSYASSFVGLFTAIATLGLDGIVIRELVKDENRRDELLGTAFILKLIGALVMLILLFFAVDLTTNEHTTNVIIFIIAAGTIFQSFNVIDMYFQSKVLSKFIVYTNMFSLLLVSMIKIILILISAPLMAFVWITLFNSFIVALGYLYFYFHNHLSISSWRFDKILAMQLLRNSWPLVLSGIVVSIYMKIDQVMIKEMMNSEAVGQYAAAVRISEAWYFIPVVISSSLFPAIINAKKISEELYYERLQKLYDFMVWMAIAIALPMTFLSNWVVDLLYGSQYNQAGSVLMIHIWAGIFVFLGVASNKWFVTENLQKYSFYRTLAGAFINIILNFILIPIYSIYGAAFATLISQAIASYLYNATNRKLLITFKLQTNALLLPLRKLGNKFE